MLLVIDVRPTRCRKESYDQAPRTDRHRRDRDWARCQPGASRRPFGGRHSARPAGQRPSLRRSDAVVDGLRGSQVRVIPETTGSAPAPMAGGASVDRTAPRNAPTTRPQLASTARHLATTESSTSLTVRMRRARSLPPPGGEVEPLRERQTAPRRCPRGAPTPAPPTPTGSSATSRPELRRASSYPAPPSTLERYEFRPVVPRRPVAPPSGGHSLTGWSSIPQRYCTA